MKTFLRRLLKSQDGNVLIITGVTFLMLVTVSGAGVDLGRQQLVRSKIQQASDAASIAAATLPEGTSTTVRANTARRYFNLNFPDGFMGIRRPAPSVSVTADGSISVTANARTPTRFVKFLGIDSLRAVGRSVVNNSSSIANQDYDVVAVIDESGSTGAFSGSMTRMEQEKNALRDMVSSLFPVGVTNPNLRLGMVGYTGYISNVGGLTSNRATALSYIDRLAPRCHNYDHFGLQAGLKMITGDWSSFKPVLTPCPINWSAVHQNTDVDPPRTARSDGRNLSAAKHIVFLTDGYIMVEPPGPPYPNYPIFLQACDRIKAAGVTLYTISFASQTPGDADTLRTCASKDEKGQPRYFYAPDGATLKSILSGVGETIKKIRIAE